jgi:26S proteasome regulatory subunit N5
MSTAEKKQEADFTAEVDALIPTAEGLAKGGKLQEALEQVYTLEKKARNAADLSSTTRLLLLSLQLLRTTPSATSPDWDGLNEAIISLSRKHGQLKQAITKMVGAAMCYLHPPGIGETGKNEEEKEKEVEMKEVEKEEDKAKKEAEKAALVNQDDESPSKEKDEKKQKMKEAVDGAMEDKGEGKENEGVRIMMEQAKAVGNTGVTVAMKIKLVETIRQVTEGKVSKPVDC